MSNPGIRIGTAPDSWGVWFPDDPKQIPWNRFLDEVVAAGYHWIELGPFGYLPTDPNQLQDELAKRDLQLSAGTVFTGLHKGDDQWKRAWDQALNVAGLVSKLGAEHLVVIPDLWRSDSTAEVLVILLASPPEIGAIQISAAYTNATWVLLILGSLKSLVDCANKAQ